MTLRKQPDRNTVVAIYMVPSGAVFKKRFKETFGCKMTDRVQDVIDRIGKEEFIKCVHDLACIVVDRNDRNTRTYDIPWYQDKVEASLHRTMQAVADSIQVTAKRRIAYLARRNTPLVTMKKVTYHQDNIQTQ